MSDNVIKVDFGPPAPEPKWKLSLNLFEDMGTFTGAITGFDDTDDLTPRQRLNMYADAFQSLSIKFREDASNLGE